jgi:hypothetical protein
MKHLPERYKRWMDGIALYKYLPAAFIRPDGNLSLPGVKKDPELPSKFIFFIRRLPIRWIPPSTSWPTC